MGPVVCLLYLLNLIGYLTGLLGQSAPDPVLKTPKSRALLLHFTIATDAIAILHFIYYILKDVDGVVSFGNLAF